MKVCLAAQVAWGGDVWGDGFYKMHELPLAPFPGLLLSDIVDHEEWIVEDVEVDVRQNLTLVHIGLNEEGNIEHDDASLQAIHDSLQRDWFPSTEEACQAP
jgi:hypothetical protein